MMSELVAVPRRYPESTPFFRERGTDKDLCQSKLTVGYPKYPVSTRKRVTYFLTSDHDPKTKHGLSLLTNSGYLGYRRVNCLFYSMLAVPPFGNFGVPTGYQRGTGLNLA